MAGSDRLATISLCLSVITATFTFYQWWNTQREAKINAAVEISKSWVQDNDIAKQQAIIGKLTHVEIETNASSDEKVAVSHYFSRLEYFAFLMNHGLIDENYIASSIKCELSYALDTMSTLSSHHSVVFWSMPEIKNGTPRFQDACEYRKAPGPTH